MHIIDILAIKMYNLRENHVSDVGGILSNKGGEWKMFSTYDGNGKNWAEMKL